MPHQVHTFPIWGSESARPTVRMTSACRMQRCVHTVSEASHWYNVTRCWSSMCPSQETSWYLLADSQMLVPMDRTTYSEVSLTAGPETMQYTCVLFCIKSHYNSCTTQDIQKGECNSSDSLFLVTIPPVFPFTNSSSTHQWRAGNGRAPA